MINLLFFIATAVTVILIYRQGLKDGQKVGSGERISNKGLRLFNSKPDKDSEKLIEAIKARMEYGNGMKK